MPLAPTVSPVFSASGEARPLKILLIEDEADHALVARHLLRAVYGTGFTLDHISTAEAARAEICRGEHDVALLDYRLGDCNGLDVLREAHAAGCQMPVILLTGTSDHGTDMAAMRSGAADYLIKGEISVQGLERTIRYAIERQRAQEAIRQMRGELEDRTSALTRACEIAEQSSQGRAESLARLREVVRLRMQATLEEAAHLEAGELSGEQRECLGRIVAASRELLGLAAAAETGNGG